MARWEGGVLLAGLQVDHKCRTPHLVWTSRPLHRSPDGTTRLGGLRFWTGSRSVGLESIKKTSEKRVGWGRLVSLDLYFVSS